MRQEIENLRVIKIPKTDVVGGAEVEMSVKPTNDAWLVEAKRKWAEIDEVLELRIDGMRINIQVAEMCSARQARVKAYAQLYSEYKALGESWGSKLTSRRKEHEDAMVNIKGQQGLGKTERLSREKEAEAKYQTEVAPWEKARNNARRIREMVLKKAILDKLPVSDLAKLESDSDIDCFIGDLGLFMNTTTQGEIMASVNYKETDGLATNSAILERWGETADAYINGNPNQKKLAGGYLRLMANRADWQSRKRLTGVEMPYLTLLHDTMAAVLIKPDERTWGGLGKIIDVMVGDKISTDGFKNEIKTITSQYIAGAIKAREEYLGRTDEELKELLAKAEKGLNLAEVSEQAKKRMTNDTDRYMAVVDVAAALKDQPTCAEIYGMMAMNLVKIAPRPDIKNLERNNLIEQIYKQYPHVAVLAEAGITVDLRTAISRGMNYFQKRKGTSSGEREFFIQSAIGSGSVSKNEYFSYKPKVDLERLDTDRKAKENTYLWEQILDYGVWFVSPRGDHFTITDNDDLINFSLTGVTFGIDRNHPREHLVKLMFAGNRQIEMRLDVNRNLLGSSREVIYADPRVETMLINGLLERLYFVTSGLLASEQQQKPTGDESEGEAVEYRRAHYRILSSTPQRRITMQSDQAITHAQTVFEKYGIRIADETERRRLKGSLEPQQFLTFVQEVVPVSWVRTAKPNDIYFDGSKVHIPV